MDRALTLSQANLKMALWQIEVDSMNDTDLYVWISNAGFSDSIALRLHELIKKVQQIGNKVISVGKIILIKILEFIKAHPHLAIGVALGISVSILVRSIPFFGQFLAPLAMILGVGIGAIAGHRLDKKQKGEEVYGVTIIEQTQEVIEIFKEFFYLLIEVFRLVFAEINS
ncbi:MAG: DUF2273 domain-containing protein [Cyanobacterium sp. T60_A2020_053]|nr:DUF2273 domain-containing protein [Cyanobacterium sp. T60_A2020_053]